MSSLTLSLPDWFNAGGPAMWLLAVLSVLSVAVLLTKIAQFLLLRPWQAKASDQALAALARHDLAAARDALSQASSPVDQLLAGALALKPEPASASWQEEVLRQARAQLEPLRNGLRVLEVTGVLAPLIGLLGTVFGMITAFQALEMAGSQVDPALLSGGIWEALMTTAAGLVVAIPALAAFHFCDRIIEQCRHLMEDRLARLRVLLAGNGFDVEEDVAAAPDEHVY